MQTLRIATALSLAIGFAVAGASGRAIASNDGSGPQAGATLIAQQAAQHSDEHKDHDHKGDDHKEPADHKDHDHKSDEAHKDHDHKGDDHKGDDHKDHDHKAQDSHKHDEPAKEPGKRSDTEHDHDHAQSGHDHKPDESARHGEPGHAHAADEKTGHGHGDHGGGGDTHGDGHSERVKLTPAQLKEFDIAVEKARSGDIASAIVRPAEIKFNQDRVAHVVPRVAGVVRAVMASEGDRVAAGAVMAVIDSRELADAKAAYLAAFERSQLARETFAREEGLWKQKISSEKEFLDTKSEFTERKIELRAASQKLRALGFDQAFLDRLVISDDDALTEYSLVAPFAGTVITRHITRGEAIDSDDQAFLLSDVGSLWIDITVYPKDLAMVRAGQAVSFETGQEDVIAEGRIEFVTSHVSENTRTASARTTVSNADGRLRPGMFIKARINTGSESASVRVPKSAIQQVEEGNVIFVEEEGGFSPRPVRLGKINGEFAEVLSGLTEGETYVSRGAFTLKAQLSKESFGDGHNH